MEDDKGYCSNLEEAVEVGDPDNPGTLQAAIEEAYGSGARSIVIREGKYILPEQPDGVLMFRNMQDLKVSAAGVELVTCGRNTDGILFLECTNVTFTGATMRRDEYGSSQGEIVDLGSDPDDAGVFYTVLVDEGYPTDVDWAYNSVMDGNSRRFKPGNWDLGWVTSIEQLGGRRVRIHSANPKTFDTWTVRRGDYLTWHAGGKPQLHLDRCTNCLVQDITYWASPSWCAIRTDQCHGARFLRNTITYGPPPPGATNPPLITTGSGLQGIDDYEGPYVEDCHFEGMSDDGFDLRGGLVGVTAVQGHKATVDRDWWRVGDPVRLADEQGGYQDAKVESTAQAGENRWELVLDDEVTVRVAEGEDDFKTMASNPSRCCGGYKILNTTVLNNRARGALVRGDNGLIQGCRFEGNTHAAVLVGLEEHFGWGEAGYCHNVTIAHNTFCGTGFSGICAVLVAGSGALGNRGISVQENLFIGNYGPNIIASDVKDLKIKSNSFQKPFQEKYGDGSIISLKNADGITFDGNQVTEPGPHMEELVKIGSGVQRVTNNSPEGIAVIGAV